MRWLSARRPHGLVALIVAAAPALFAASGPGARARVAGGEALVANSVCEAQELKARKAEDPDLAIEIPPQFDKAFPTLMACRSLEAAWDPEAPGPNQPIPFSHKHHAGAYGMDCLYCHSGTDRSRMAGVPSVELCMGCHAAFPQEYDELECIRILKDHWERKEPIPWVQIHRLPQHAKFRHQRHVAAGLDCQTCHGPVQELEKLYLVPDTGPERPCWCWARGASPSDSPGARGCPPTFRGRATGRSSAEPPGAPRTASPPSWT